ncbi:MAG: DEAD/DEAH box helicase, partial [Desulfobulbaceae bacterium]|nr:DEAD/DEAH box helicase [Desulfobulbaceae bacterium]
MSQTNELEALVNYYKFFRYLQKMISLDILNQTKKIFSPAGILARKLADYESRPGQLAMAEAVASILQESESQDDISDMGRTLAVEAETGIGKTLAYLVPAALSRQKIIVSTGTLNLQDQILNKEIPFIRKYIDPELSALCVKGRQNYLCLYRWKQFFSSSRPSLFNTGLELDEMRDWLRKSRTGDRAELDWLEDNSPLWREVSATSSQCLGGNCPEGEACFLNRL